MSFMLISIHFSVQCLLKLGDNPFKEEKSLLLCKAVVTIHIFIIISSSNSDISPSDIWTNLKTRYQY